MRFARAPESDKDEYEVGVEVNPNEIETCHILKERGMTIITFLRRPDCQRMHRVKKELKIIGKTNPGFVEGIRLLLQSSLVRVQENLERQED